MTIDNIIKAAAETSGKTQKDIREAYHAIAAAVAAALPQMQEGDSLRLPNLVTLKVKAVPERECRNPATGEKFVKPAHLALKASLPANVKALVQ